MILPLRCFFPISAASGYWRAAWPLREKGYHRDVDVIQGLETFYNKSRAQQMDRRRFMSLNDGRSMALC